MKNNFDINKIPLVALYESPRLAMYRAWAMATGPARYDPLELSPVETRND
jgi:hypothetical protein